MVWAPVDRLAPEKDPGRADVVPLVRLEEAVLGVRVRDEAVGTVGQRRDIEFLAADARTVEIAPADRDAADRVAPAAPVVLPARRAGCLRKAALRVEHAGAHLLPDHRGRPGSRELLEPVLGESVEVPVLVGGVE